MRGLLLLCGAMLSGCTYGAVGRWEILAVNIGEDSVADAGFLDLIGLEADRIYETNIVLLRYAWDPVSGEFVPDATPDISSVSTNAEQLVKGETTLNMDFPLADGTTAATAMSILARTSDEMVLEDTAFAEGAGMTWLLSRSGELSADEDTGG